MRKISLVGLCLVWLIGCGSPTPPPTQKSKPTQVAGNQQSKPKKKTTSTKKKPAPKKEAESQEPEPGPAELMPESDPSKPAVEEKPEPETAAEATPEKAAPAEASAAAKETASKPAVKVKLSDDWAKSVTVQDLLSELNYSVGRMAQNLKKPGDFDKFLKELKADGDLAAILAALIAVHPDSGEWQAVAAGIQGQALELAEAAKAKGAKNFHTAQEAHKKIGELLKKGESGSKGGAPGGDVADPDWAALGELKSVMKQIERNSKRVHGAASDESAFKKSADDIRHDAAVLAVLTEITPAFRPNEADMVELSAKVAIQVRASLKALESHDFEKAKNADTAMNKACQECHKIKRFVKKGEDLGF